MTSDNVEKAAVATQPESQVRPDNGKARLVLPPAMQPKTALQIANATPLIQAEAQTQQAHTAKLSEEQRLACAQQYNETMSEARELPLGDYARINQQAMQERERCLQSA
jgi:hypothetical protein